MILKKEILKYLDKRRGAIHVGAHLGQEADWYLLNGFQPVIWLEPNPELYDDLCSNISHYPMNFVFGCGIHDKLSSTMLHVANGDAQSSSILEFGSHSKYHPEVKFVKDIKVPLFRLDDFLSKLEKGISLYNFLNIDVQGVELNVIKSLGSLVEKLDYIYTEVNEEEVYKGCSLITDIDEYLKPFGFYRICTKIYPKVHWGDALYKRY